MEYGWFDEVLLGLRYFTLDNFIETLKSPEIGVISKQSWDFWQVVLGLETADNSIPPMPHRGCFDVEDIKELEKDNNGPWY
ncbi:hypothetical protein ABSA28_00191 [Candidatus Hepatincolaceae symbiont of Richtersius coronifer]